ncbi:hypothetical protein BTVI_06055 [Pitangus sulphuratus]|nr:hypothetical protein BTVI_06055 [Pitangus sulphuratus]
MLCLMPPKTRLALLADRALLTHIQPAINQDSQVPFHGTAFHHVIPQSVEVKSIRAFEEDFSGGQQCHVRFLLLVAVWWMKAPDAVLAWPSCRKVSREVGFGSDPDSHKSKQCDM